MSWTDNEAFLVRKMDQDQRFKQVALFHAPKSDIRLNQELKAAWWAGYDRGRQSGMGYPVPLPTPPPLTKE